MSLIGRRSISLSLEHMSQMASTVTAHDLRSLHTESAINVSRHSAGDVIEVRRPSAAGLELVGGFVERGVAGGAGVDALGGHVLVIFAGEWGFGALVAEDAELLWRKSASAS